VNWAEGDDQESTLPFDGQVPIAPGAALTPTLTVLAHPDVSRIGDRLALASRSLTISRTDGPFTSPDHQRSSPLSTRWISRSAIDVSIRPDGAVRIAHDPARVRLDLGGETAPASIIVPLDRIARGVSWVINGTVALLMHQSRLTATPERHGLIGYSDAMVRLRDRIDPAARSGLSVLVRGETGTGKELVAQALHTCSARADRPFIAVNLGAIPTALAASTLFGHETGAFSGAGAGQPGAFRAAEGGTLFLDEVGEAPAAVQTALLRVLEAGEIMPVGRSRPVGVDVRVVAATDFDLERAAAEGRFRSALLERLGALELHTPALRARPEDVGRLLFHFLSAGSAAHRLSSATRPDELWPPAAIVARLASYDWPRNVRQLRNIAFEMATFSAEGPFEPGPKLSAILRSTSLPVGPAVSLGSPGDRAVPDRSVDGLSALELRALLKTHRWRVSVAARALGVSQGAMYRLLKRRGIAIARDLDAEQFETALRAAGGDLRTMADRLQMSVRALTLRRRQLGLSPDEDGPDG